MLDNKIEVKVSKCPICNRSMIDRQWKRIDEYRMVVNGLADWTKARGIVYNSDVKDSEDEEICEICKSKGKANFRCALCNEIKPSSKSKKSFGYPAEHLCIDCYNSVTVAVWEDKENELHDLHQYDFE
jgi:hypothetical protein